MSKLTAEQINDSYIVISVTHAGKKWEVLVSADFDEDGGLQTEIVRGDTLCTSTSFGWDEKHENEAQEG